ncbi:MAG: hypothetical protein A3D31_11385 [Candidatus Fluviicola riflensis]|nr:MAG: hypothetical protein CHH17_15810 [Candidatus Fluviicola riflensis]OGS77592.1 MAG: hypothetical protein A3D31_11385 [Candidatus Fluviicola riflensis]OGS84174.1 MAG: hypothetical protein A3E30_12790 [Fluviicola sp. RIFCSPHIGHO2_12_FULL_43_24]OGS84658.1 MAG: hypothetical protein A2724_08320 [Fluviicola sp. RIFCSPHIGHO2_01_FULL_43_53]
MAQPREAKMMLVAGRKGVGKTYQTLCQITDYLKTTFIKQGRKVLIFDVNNEFGNVKEDHKNPNFPNIGLIKLSQVPAFANITRPFARRVSVFKDNGQRMSLSEMAKALGYILEHYRNGLLLIEDISKYITDSLPGDLIGSICTQRHVSVDVVIHVQTVGKLFNPKLWGNCNELRMHRSDDTIERHKNKISGNIEHLLIMERLIDLKFKAGETHFCCFLNKDTGKIKGRFTKPEFYKAVEDYLASNYQRILKPLLDKRNVYTGEKMYQNQKEAVNDYMRYLVTEYL